MSTRRLLIDTAFVQALLNRADQYHNRATAWLPRLRSTLEAFITEAVLLEVGNAMSATDRTAAVEFIRAAYATPTVRVVPVDRALLLRAVELYEQRPDKHWGLVDCISFVVMKDHEISDALTPDHHFEQAGFTALLRHDPPTL